MAIYDGYTPEDLERERPDNTGLEYTFPPLSPDHPWDLRLADQLAELLMARKPSDHGGLRRSWEAMPSGGPCLCRWCKARRLLAERRAPRPPGVTGQTSAKPDPGISSQGAGFWLWLFALAAAFFAGWMIVQIGIEVFRG